MNKDIIKTKLDYLNYLMDQRGYHDDIVDQYYRTFDLPHGLYLSFQKNTHHYAIVDRFGVAVIL